MQLFNRKLQKNRRRILRNKMTSAEIDLWRELRNEKLGYKFRRQFGVGHYIVDFYCPKLKFVIELDGETHTSEEARRKDVIRDKFINDCGLTVKRFWNHEVYEDINAVLEVILLLCEDLNRRRIGKVKDCVDSPSKIRGRYRGS